MDKNAKMVSLFFLYPSICISLCMCIGLCALCIVRVHMSCSMYSLIESASFWDCSVAVVQIPSGFGNSAETMFWIWKSLVKGSWRDDSWGPKSLIPGFQFCIWPLSPLNKTKIMEKSWPNPGTEIRICTLFKTPLEIDFIRMGKAHDKAAYYFTS